MTYVYKGFIKENIAPRGAERIEVFDENGEKRYSMSLGKLSPKKETPLYSFGIISDTHIQLTDLQLSLKLDNALAWFKEQGVKFVCHTGDITNRGFRNSSGEDAFDQFNEYKIICDLHNVPVYAACGNHDSFYGNVTNYLEKLQEYTGHGLVFSITQGEDMFIFLGQPSGSVPMSDEALLWLYTTLEANRNRRCFIFVHPHISSGNALGAYSTNPIFDWWGIKTAVFVEMLNHYKNTILFHGHSHIKFEAQELDVKSTYTTEEGFRSIHVPSLSLPKDVVDGKLVTRDNESQGYIVDVYDECIVLNGMDLINNQHVPIGVYEIDTTLEKIEANTFPDSTGIIQSLKEKYESEL